MRSRNRRGECGALRLSVLGLAVLLACGCQSMTQRKMTALIDEQEKRLQALDEQIRSREAEESRRSQEEVLLKSREEKRDEAARRLAAGDAAGALALLDALLAASPESAPPETPKQATAEGAKEAPPEAAKEAPAAPAPVAAPLSPGEKARLLVLKAQALLELRRHDDSLAACRQALDLEPREPGAFRTLGKIHLAEKRCREALQAWRNELRDGHQDSEILLLVGEAAQEVAQSESSAAELEAARLAFERVFLSEPTDTNLTRRLADIEYATGRYADAVRYLDLSRKESPLDPDVLEKLGASYVALRRHELALNYLELAAGLRPPSKELCTTLADLLVELRVPGRAAEWLSRGYKTKPAHAPPEVRFRAGSLFAEAGRSADAVVWLKALGEGDASYNEAQSLLVRLEAELGNGDEALVVYERTRKSGSPDGRASVTAGGLFLERKQLDQAADAFSRASAAPDTKVEGMAGLAEVAYEKGDLERAVMYYRSALELRPGDTRLAAASRQVQGEIQSLLGGSRQNGAADSK